MTYPPPYPPQPPNRPPYNYPPTDMPGGYPGPAPKKRKWPYIVGGILLFLVVVGSCSGNKAAAPITSSGAGTTQAISPSIAVSTADVPAPAPTVIKVKTMGDDFENNQIAGEQKWGGQYIQFTAPVGNIDGSGGISFTDVTTQFSFTQVACDLADTSGVAKLSKGKPATVRGMVNPNQVIGVIRLDDCELVG